MIVSSSDIYTFNFGLNDKYIYCQRLQKRVKKSQTQTQKSIYMMKTALNGWITVIV